MSGIFQSGTQTESENWRKKNVRFFYNFKTKIHVFIWLTSLAVLNQPVQTRSVPVFFHARWIASLHLLVNGVLVQPPAHQVNIDTNLFIGKCTMFIQFCVFDYYQNLFSQWTPPLAPNPDIGSSFRGQPVVVRNVQPHCSRRENVTCNLCVQHTGAIWSWNISMKYMFTKLKWNNNCV